MIKKDLLDLIQYIAKTTIDLKNKYIDEKDLPIDYLTIFSHSEDEFNEMKNIASDLGEVIDNNNGPVYRLHRPTKIPTGELKYLRIRHPDSKRPQKGCDDFRVDNYHAFKEKYSAKFKENIKLIVRPEYEMIEIKDSKFDVLVYFPSIMFSEYLAQKLAIDNMINLS